jgi:hypothetical protein
MLPSEDVMRELVARYAVLLAEHRDAFEGAELITPTSEHFPDHWARDAKSVGRLLERIVSYTPLGEDVPLALQFIEDAADDGHCTTGCSKPGARIDGIERVGAGYRISVGVAETASPTRLVCALARGASAAVLAETGCDDEGNPAIMGEVVAAACGFGVVLLEGSHVYTKSCGGPSIHNGTALTPGEAAFLLALFCALHDVPGRAARKHLGATQSEAFDEAASFVDKNSAVVEKLRDAPELLASGAFEFENRRGLLSRLFERKAEPKPAEPRAVSRQDDELKALVEEEFR